MPFTSESARAARARVSSETASAQSAQRWTPDARVRAAIKALVDNAPALTPELVERLRALLPEPTATSTTRGRAA